MLIKDNFQVQKKNPRQYNTKLLAFSEKTQDVSDELYVQVADTQNQLSFKWTNEKERVQALVSRLENTVEKLYNLADRLNRLYDDAIGS